MMNVPLLSDHQEERFRIILWLILGLYAVAGIAVTLSDVPPPARGVTKLPPRIAKLIIPPKPEAPPVPEVKPVEPTGEEEVVPEEEVQPEPEVMEVSEKPPISTEELAEQQRRRDMEVAMNSGLLSLLTSTDMRPLSADVKISKTFSGIKSVSRKAITLGNLGGSAADASGGIDDIVSRLEKGLKNSAPILTDDSLARSGGIDLADASTAIDERNLGERKTTSVENPFQIKGYSDGDSPRTYESISSVVEKFKGGISIVYNRALRRDPTLRGTITVEFTIAADGEVIDSKVASSTMEDPAFEEAILRRVLGWRFPPIAEGDVTVVYPLVFYVTG